MVSLSSIFMGMVCGVVVSFLTGSVFFALVKTSIQKGFRAGYSFASGVFIGDSLYTAFIFLGLTALIEQYKFYLGVGGSIFLFILGIIYLFSKAKITIDEPEPINRGSYMAKGFVMNILNPSVPVLWIVVLNIITQWHYTRLEKGVFFCIALITMLGVDTLKAYYVSKIREYITERNMVWLNRIAGFALMLLAARMLFKAIE